jgi:hypothetical protein
VYPYKKHFETQSKSLILIFANYFLSPALNLFCTAVASHTFTAYLYWANNKQFLLKRHHVKC